MEQKKTIDPSEAPPGFYAVAKNTGAKNACDECDAKPLCQKNEDEWCLHNRCMAYPITAFKDGKTYGRNDGASVVFKRTEE